MVHVFFQLLEKWITQSISASGTMSVSVMGIPFLDSAINYIETDSLEPYKLSFFDDNTRR